MKRSFTKLLPHLATIILMLVFFALGSGNHTRLRTLEIEKRSLLAEMTSRGLDPDQPPPLSTRSKSPNRQIDIEKIAQEFIECGRLFQDYYQEDDFRKLPQAEREQAISAIESVMSLNGNQLKTVISLVVNENDLSDYLRQRLLHFPLIEWARKNPEAAFDHLIQSPNLLAQLKSSGVRQVQTGIIDAWLKQDSQSLLRWIRESHETLTPEMQKSLIWQFAGNLVKHRPLETFDFIQEFSDEPSSYFPAIFRGQSLTLPQKSQVLTRIRELSVNMPANSRSQFLAKNLQALVIGQSSNGGSFQDAIAVIETNQIKKEELKFLWDTSTADLNFLVEQSEISQWIPWLRKTFLKKSKQRVRELLLFWQRRDLEAAAAFLKQRGE